jgi:hypothetical protein
MAVILSMKILILVGVFSLVLVLAAKVTGFSPAAVMCVAGISQTGPQAPALERFKKELEEMTTPKPLPLPEDSPCLPLFHPWR